MSDDVTAGGGGDETGGHMTIVEHLNELRGRLIKCVVAVMAGALVMWIAYPWVLDILLVPYEEAAPDGRLILTDPLQGLSTRMRVAGYGGVALATPVLLWQLWRFVTPGLYPRERRYAVPFVASGVILFLLGAGLAFWTLPKALGFLIAIGGEVEASFTPDRYVQLIAYMMLAFGIGFEFPIVLIFLQLAGVLRSAQLRSFRRYAIVLIVVVVAVITPSGDPISLMALSVPMYLFYEVSALIGRIIERRRARADA